MDELRTPVRVTGMAAVSALGRGIEPLLTGALAGAAAFGQVRRFDVAGRRVTVAATLPEVASLPDELVDAADTACRAAGLTAAQRAGTALMLAVHADPDAARATDSEGRLRTAADLARTVASRAGLGDVLRVYTTACVSGSTAISDAAALLSRGRLERVVVVGGYLVESDQFALFDVGGALATDGAVRPFSTGRTGLLLGDAVAAVVLESAVDSGRDELARVAGWGRAGDAYHPCQPHPEGLGLARAIRAALHRAGLAAEQIGYINAHGTGTGFSDASEAAALHRALGAEAATIPISSTKAVHGHTLEASGVIELVATVLAMRSGKLPVNAGFRAPDEECRLNVVTDAPRALAGRHALSLNAAFGGASTALVLEVGGK